MALISSTRPRGRAGSWFVAGILCCVAAAAWPWLSPAADAPPPTPAAPAPAAPAPAAPRRVKVLFLGDRGHHQPIERCRQLYKPLAERGIDLTYTERLADLTPTNLARYDGLLLYANIEKIAPDQEQALLDFVAGGRGFIPLHCASACFNSSPKIVALMGARFLRHGTGVFRETIAKADHPIEKGLKPIESWDETYVHADHNEENREVLGHRIDGDHKEPWTWARTHGKGRVFYTAWGHDERTWSNADFLNLVERGVRWACGDWALAARPALKPFEYDEAEVPNYRPGLPAGETGAERTPMQRPVSPEESVKHMVLPPGFEARLFSPDPTTHKPIALAWDERGRLWVAETVDYPNSKQPLWQGNDRITIHEDTDGDGRADKVTVFADKLSIPTALVFARGGIIVSQAPEMLFLKDTDGDDKADVKEVMFTGWGVGDTHAGPSNLRYGFDGWVYGTVGYSAFKGTVGGQALSFGSGAFRLKPDGSKLEFLGSSNNNTWGYGFSEDNQGFISTANGNPSFYVSIPNRVYEQLEGFSPKRPVTIADTWKFFPVLKSVRQVDYFGGYTAAAGHALYTARSFPREYWNRVAFVTDPTGHLVGQFAIEPRGATFAARNEFSFLASDDEWTAPIVAEVGPDGALWVIDWYAFIVQHNPIPKGFQKGKGNAYETPLRDKKHGRIYRVIYAAGQPSRAPKLAGATGAELVAGLRSDNLLWRMHAQRLIAERGNRDVVPALVKLAGDATVDDIGLNAPAVHALWALHLLGATDGTDAAVSGAVLGAMKHASAGVRRAALDVLPRTPDAAKAVLSGNLLTDPDAHVRKAALLALAEMPPAEDAGAAALKALTRREDAGDASLADAATAAAARHAAGFLAAALAADPARAPAAPGATSVRFERTNLLKNASMEDGTGARPRQWAMRHYTGTAGHEWAAEGRTGRRSLKVTSEAGADSSWFTDVACDPHTDYTLSAWIKTDKVEKVGRGVGALLNIHGTPYRTPALVGTADWRKVEIAFNSGPLTTLSINCLFGGWGQAKGAALFDDVELVPAKGMPTATGVGRVVALVSRQVARRGDAAALSPTLAALPKADPALAAVVIDALASAWPANSAPTLTPADVAALQDVYRQLPPEGRDRLYVLAERWNRRDLFTAEAAAAAKELLATIADARADGAKRIGAAQRMLALADTGETAAAIVEEISPAAPPDVQLGLVEALAASRENAVGAAIVARWKKLAPGAQAAAAGVLLRRPAWTRALVEGVEAGQVNPRDLKNEHWQSLVNHPDKAVADLARKLQSATGRISSEDRQKLVDKLTPLARQKGDVKLGLEVFQKQCLVCHSLGGEGKQVGPDLTGIGIRPKSENLIDIIDPNRSVEGTYRDWVVETRDEVVTGRLFAETQTSIDIIDTTGNHHEIPRKAIRSLTTSNRSVMPEGFEQLTPGELSGLLEYLAVHAATPKK